MRGWWRAPLLSPPLWLRRYSSSPTVFKRRPSSIQPVAHNSEIKLGFIVWSSRKWSSVEVGGVALFFSCTDLPTSLSKRRLQVPQERPKGRRTQAEATQMRGYSKQKGGIYRTAHERLRNTPSTGLFSGDKRCFSEIMSRGLRRRRSREEALDSALKILAIISEDGMYN